uniref:Uncharacterized protein n=1 Tax=Hordeum vulgare subsp. vulgare TaxID=112509 RepID=A0A8I6Y391_HORVV
MYRLRVKDKIKMAIKRGFNDEDEEEVTQMRDPMNLKEATLADKITKEALAKVIPHRKASALTAAPRTAKAPSPALENATGPTATLETAPTFALARAIH